MSNCITCGQGIPQTLKTLIEQYRKNGVSRWFYRLNEGSWQMVDDETFKIIDKKYNGKRNKRTKYEYYHITEIKEY